VQTCSYCTFRVFSPNFSSQDAGSWRYSKLRSTLLLLCLDSKLSAYVVEGGLDNGKKVTKFGFLLGPEGLASKLWASCTCFSLYLLSMKVDLGNFSSSCRLLQSYNVLTLCTKVGRNVACCKDHDMVQSLNVS
jgi:hypothetical protein